MNRRRRKQMAFHDFPTGFTGARIFPNNRWVQMSERMPWDLIDEKYAENFEGSKNGNVAVSSRVAFGALVIKHELKLSDEETVTMIRENPHCQYFLGYSEFTDVPPFDSSKMVAFRRRFPAEVLAEINEAIIRRQTKENDPSSSSDDEPPSNHGTLILDATCVPADIHYPTDAGVLNDAREKSEQLIDVLHARRGGGKKPRTYRRIARKNYLTLVRNKRPSFRLIRKTRRSQLQYLRRNLGHLERMAETSPLTEKEQQLVDILQKVYDQQQAMYTQRRRSVDHRIVSVSQPHIRPIVRGKLVAQVEFGAKLALSLENGYARVEKLSFEAFNESTTLQASCERYKARNGYYPERVLADKIYRTRKNLQYCAEHGITLNGPKLGRPPKDRRLYEAQKCLERQEAGERNAIEGKFGEAKRRYGLNRVMTRLSGTSASVIHLITIVMNLKKSLRDLLLTFFQLWQRGLIWRPQANYAFGQ
ncbi:MAG: IS5 family transposase [Clostridiaceae bacterium]|nr:IS5 family transposase [Clostridiaceae bacterium]